MKDYLYLWNDPDRQFLVASGIEFKDFLKSLDNLGGIALIEHQSEISEFDPNSRFEFVSSSNIPKLINENIYSWGNFVWADYADSTIPIISDKEIAELLFFAHKVVPLTTSKIASLNNKYLAYIHDDGWYLQLHYSNWEHIKNLIESLKITNIGAINLSDLKQGKYALWLQGGVIHHEEMTHDVDIVLNRRLFVNGKKIKK
ncbi:hypothetical protein [Solimicrobium silvestre]|uniref:Uncharacterized protein n=1 Tax=Solimicrobium silvestre TaxID=2099400 RepID=A0A2S9GSC4_9BURK|nr:hypothetical protein [Solimicrobium silvestre]PRC90596.1 hypothetical protein S2091_4703 [Solimicrobium silvestre]